MMNRSRLRPRWAKILADLVSHKTRSLLVVASIAVGVFAVGTIANASMILSQDFGASYAAVNPANITILTQPFDEALLNSVRQMPGVRAAEGRYQLRVNSVHPDGQREGLALTAIEHPAQAQIGTLEPREGTVAVADDELLIGFNALNPPRYGVGDLLTLELANGTLRRLRVAGVVLDQTAEPDPTGSTRGYIALGALTWLGETGDYDRLLVAVDGDGNDTAHIASIATTIERKLIHSGRQVLRTSLARSNQHPQSTIVLAALGILAALGVLVMLLSGSLIFNTLNALLAQDLRQIGVMKLIGARSGQVLGMYLVQILIMGLIALCLAVPAAALAGYGLSRFLAFLLNANLQGLRFFPATIAMQFILALLVPLAAGYLPVHRGAKIEVQRAIAQHDAGQAPAIGRWWQRLTAALPGLSRPIVLSLRNTFRRQGRLLLTLVTLVLAGAILIAVLNARASMQDYMVIVEQHFSADVTLALRRPYRIATVEQTIGELPGIQRVEAWSGASAEIKGPGDTVIKSLQISAPPADSTLIDPPMGAGRWLLPEDRRAIVVADALRDVLPGVAPGDTLRLSVAGGAEEDWVLVGMFSFPSYTDELIAYAPLETISTLQHAHNRSANYRIVIDDASLAGQNSMAVALDQHLRARGFAVGTIQTGANLQDTSSQMVGIAVTLLMFMALLTAIVGSIGLMGTMSMNVMERTREIGIARTLGAVDAEIIKSVVIESGLIGLLSWALALPLSFPISHLLLGIMGMTMRIGAIELVFTPQGMIIWLGVVLVLTLLASILPARNASRLTIREVLAYE